MRSVRRLIVMVVAIYVGLAAVIAALQRQLLFFPTREPESAMLVNANTLELEPWRSEAGEIIGWTPRTQPGTRATQNLVVFHGNAGHAIHRADYALRFHLLRGERPWNVWLFEYPGYGARKGEPGREAFAKAARGAIAQLRKTDAGPVFLLGESLGSGVACDLAENPTNGIAGLVLITPFTRLADVGQMHFPWLPVRLILRDRWDNAAALAKFGGPTAVLIAGRDEVVSTAQGELLFESLTGPKKRWFFPEATHNDSEIQGAEWASEVSDFLIGTTDTKR